MDNCMNIAMVFLFIIIIFLVINQKNMSRNKEKFTLSSDDLTLVRTEINRIYDMDVEAIRNLGAISKSLLTGTNTFTPSTSGTPGDLNIPADNTILQGGLSLLNTTWEATKQDNTSHIVSDTTSYKSLMIVGNNSSGTKKISLWDDVSINNNLSVGGLFSSNHIDETGGRVNITGGITLPEWNTLRWDGRGIIESPTGPVVFSCKEGVSIYNSPDGSSIGDLNVERDIIVGRNLHVKSDLTVDGMLLSNYIHGNGYPVTVMGGITLPERNKLKFEGWGIIESTDTLAFACKNGLNIYNAPDGSSVGDLTIDRDTTVGRNLKVRNNLSIDNNLTIGNDLEIKGKVNGNLLVNNIHGNGSPIRITGGIIIPQRNILKFEGWSIIECSDKLIFTSKSGISIDHTSDGSSVGDLEVGRNLRVSGIITGPTILELRAMIDELNARLVRKGI